MISFGNASEERGFRDELYANGGWWAGDDSVDTVEYDKLWSLEPGCIQYLKSIGDVRGKNIPLFGNGTSIKQLLVVKQGAHVTFSDLSFAGVLYVMQHYSGSKWTQSSRRP